MCWKCLRFVGIGCLCLVFLAASPAGAKDGRKDVKSDRKSSGSVRNVEQGGKTYIQRDRTFDPKAVDAKGRTNVQRMEKGGAPIGRDGQPVQLHHTDQRNDGTRVEMTGTEHRKVPHKR
jgi:hypothetical protein